ncbi:MAG: hypothetical protein K6A98_04640 [Prevotella sp.]|jgi:hypothetical protein|nr:hypothetical protein [Prevotella sp.]MCR5152425.1 hypothetical protein [Prevotella sp.]
MEENIESGLRKPTRHRRPELEAPRYDKLRQWLNIIFMLGAVVGLLFYFFGDRTVGIIVIMAAMVFKFIECALRFIPK